jgi:hypothetical protein
MKKKHEMNRRKWGAVLGAGLAAAFLWGCFNPALVPGPEEKSGADAGPGPFTVTVLVEGGPGAPVSRAVAGPDAANIQLNSLCNIVQLIVVDGEGKLAGFAETRKEGAGDSGAALRINLLAGGAYHFLLLMGHWPYTNDEGSYVYEEGPPTLLAAGFAGHAINPGSNSIAIIMRSLVADAVFIPQGPGTDLENVDARRGKEALLVPGDWKLQWTIHKGWVDKGAASAGGYGFDALLNAEKAVDGNIENPTFAEEGPSGLEVNGSLVSLDLDGLAEDDSGWMNFKLKYVPFALTGAGWDVYDLSSVFDLSGGGPVWIIRNGLNDDEQDEQTDYADAAGKNGNGALKYKVLNADEDLDGDGITNIEEIKLRTLPDLRDTDGDKFSDSMEYDNDFDPLNADDNPGAAAPGSLVVTFGATPSLREVGTRNGSSTTAAIKFTTEGHSGDARGYYKVVSRGAAQPDLWDYVPFSPALLAPGEHTSIVGPVDGKAACDVWVVIMAGGKVSSPVCIGLSEAATVDVNPGGTWYAVN